MKLTYKRSWAGNLLMFSDLTLGPSFKVKRWFAGLVSCLFGGYKFALVLRCVGLVMLCFCQRLLITSPKSPNLED